MQNDCQIYVDPEEDEVFFGCVSEKEKSVCAKLVTHAVSNPKDDCKLSEVLDECIFNINDSIEDRLGNEQLDGPKDSAQPSEEPNNSFEKVSGSSKILSNTSVELEHNYSTPMKHKIDKSILATPKSIVKADKDGGFLKVLSEIALVKAEAEGDNNSEKKKGEDEDKENKITRVIPDIKVTEATPEKGVVTSPPKNVMSTELRRFRIIYNSPQNEDNKGYKTKSKVETFESERNFKNKCLDQEVEILGSRRRKSVDLIDFTESNALSGVQEDTYSNQNIKKKNEEKVEKTEQEEKEDVVVIEPKHVDEVINLTDSTEVANNKKVKENVKMTPRPPPGLRFSKEARKVIEILKESSVDDTLNFTIPELSLEEEEENSFLTPGPLSTLDETIVSVEKPIQTQPKEASQNIVIETPIKPKTAEKERNKQTPVVSQSKLHMIKYFSERKIQNGAETRKCVKKLPLEDKRPATVEKVNDKTGALHQAPSSKIPVFAAKNSKIPLFERVARPATAKTTPSKTPSAKPLKNPKFNHIESPINAYIHNKPTALVLNVKPEGKKENMTKVWKTQTTGSGKKIQEKPSKEQQSNGSIKLPFVEYKSATPYKIEKKPESRLPRLAPTVYKLIGSQSPKVLRHEGRFYMNSPRKENSTENTIVADPNEVSVVVSQPAQKSHTIK